MNIVIKVVALAVVFFGFLFALYWIDYFNGMIGDVHKSFLNETANLTINMSTTTTVINVSEIRSQYGIPNFTYNIDLALDWLRLPIIIALAVFVFVYFAHTSKR